MSLVAALLMFQDDTQIPSAAAAGLGMGMMLVWLVIVVLMIAGGLALYLIARRRSVR